MKKFVWCTDIHLDFLDRDGGLDDVVERFVEPLSHIDCNGVFITGDISLSSQLEDHLELIDRVIEKPVYFVLGNHDFYGGKTDDVRKSLQRLCRRSKNLNYLTTTSIMSLTDTTAIIGHDGWYDALHGDHMHSNVIMSDWLKITDYVEAGALLQRGLGSFSPNMGAIVSISRKIATEAAENIRRRATLAASTHDVVVVLTHVPPFAQAHVPGGKGSSPGTMPWYTSKLMGDVLIEVSQENPGTRFEVFCGHTHGLCDVQVLDNLRCHVGGSTYGDPKPVGTIQVP